MLPAHLPFGLSLLLLSGFLAHTDAGAQSRDAAMEQAAELIRPDAVRAHVEFLADDRLEGRGTGTRGHRLAALYLRAQCAAAGLRGAAEDGGFFQKVPLVRTRVDEQVTKFQYGIGDARTELTHTKDFLVLDTHRETQGDASAGMVFAGFGVTAPEREYDDYARVDAKGKIVVILAPEAPSTFPPAARAYYSDSPVKRANAAAHGAIGMLGIASPAFAKRFPWEALVREMRIGVNSMRWLDHNGRPAGLNDSLKVSACLSPSGAEALFKGEEHSLEEVFASAEKGTPLRFTLSKTATISFRSSHERVESENVVAILEGSDPTLKDEYVLFCAHMDHLGIGDPVDGDAIYNGAMDNAGGCSVILEVARAFGRLPERPRRSVLFLFATGEEAGLLGSDYFAHHPTVPLEKIVAAVNVDGGTALVPVSDVISLGAEHSSLQEVVERAARQAGFTASPDPFPQESFFIRSDQYSFVQRGIPSVMLDIGFKGSQPGTDALARYMQWASTVYHSPKDDTSQPIQYGCSAQFARFVFRFGHAVAMHPERPHWNEDDFFKVKFESQR